MKKSIQIFSVLFVCLFNLNSCHYDKDDVPLPKNPNENELITTLKLVFTEAENPTKIIEAMFEDIDGEGGKAPVIDTIKLAVGKKYTVEIFLLDATKNPVYNVSTEIKNEGHSHQFFFSALDGVNVSFTYSDKDKNGVPIGLISEWRPTSLTTDKSANIQVILKHQQTTKPVSGNGDITIGSTDIDVKFPIRIQ